MNNGGLFDKRMAWHTRDQKTIRLLDAFLIISFLYVIGIRTSAA